MKKLGFGGKRRSTTSENTNQNLIAAPNVPRVRRGYDQIPIISEPVTASSSAPHIPRKFALPPPEPYQSSVNFWGAAQEKLQFAGGIPAAVKTLFSEGLDECDASTILHEAETAKINYFRRRGSENMQDAINKIIRSAGKFSSVIDSLTNCDPTHYAKLAWGGIRIFLVAANQNIDLHESVFEGMAYVSSLMEETLDAMIKLIFINQPPSIKNLKTVQLLRERMVNLYMFILNYLGLANLYYKTGAWGRATMSLVGMENSDIVRVLNSVRSEETLVRQHFTMVCQERGLQDMENQHVGQAETQSSIDVVVRDQMKMESLLRTFQTNQDTSNAQLRYSVNDINQHLDDTSRRFESLEVAVREILNRVQLSSRSVIDEALAEKRVKILQWISAEPYQRELEIHRNAYYYDSWSWIFEVERFKDWYRSSLPRILFLTGEAGGGKSVIISRIINELQQNLEDSGFWALALDYPMKSMVLYAYCKPLSTTASEILSCLLRQVCSQDSISFTTLQKIYETEYKNGFPSGSLCATQLRKLLHSSLRQILEGNSITVYILIDGLNNMNNEESLLLLLTLRELMEIQSGVIKILITTRRPPSGTSRINSIIGCSSFTIEINPYRFRDRFINLEITRLLPLQYVLRRTKPETYRPFSLWEKDALQNKLMNEAPRPLDQEFRDHIFDSFLDAWNSEEYTKPASSPSTVKLMTPPRRK